MVVQWYSSHHACEKNLILVILTVAFLFLPDMFATVEHLIIDFESLKPLVSGHKDSKQQPPFGDYFGDFL